MARRWADSNRRAELPKDWWRIRQRVKRRAGGQCEAMTVLGRGRKVIARGVRCPNPGTDCDHIGDPLDHSEVNLQWLCGDHHILKTAEESAAARRRLGPKKRPPEAHPGRL